MPEHSSILTLLIEALHWLKENLASNAHILGDSIVGHKAPTWQGFEPIITSLGVAGILLALAFAVRGKLKSLDDAVVPDEKLSLRTFVEVFLGYFYALASDVMGPERARKHFPVIACSSCFVFCANVMALIPGMPVATSSLSITLGSSLIVFLYFNYQGLKEQKMGYFKHMAGPVWVLAPLIFPIEMISMLVRPLTLALRLMLNMAVDHLILITFLGLFPLLLPLPVLVLGCLVVSVQTLVFTLLTCIYIGLATEHEAH